MISIELKDGTIRVSTINYERLCRAFSDLKQVTIIEALKVFTPIKNL